VSTEPLDLGQAAVDVAAALEAARADEREKVARRIVAHADKHAPKGDPATATLRRHLLLAARVAAGPMTIDQVAEALTKGDYMVCLLDEAGQTIAEGER
jgi:hypothetical protein